MHNEISQRMKSIKQTVQISGAQKVVAATQIGKARKLLADSEPYHDKVNSAITYLLRQCPGVASRYIDRGDSANAKRGLLVIASNRGLAGNYNSKIIHKADEALAEKPVSEMIILGHSCHTHFANLGYPVNANYNHPIYPPTMFDARELAEVMIGMLENGKIDIFDVIYTTYHTSVRMTPVTQRLFPLEPSLFTETGGDTGFQNVDFEPSPEHVLDFMMQKYLKGYLFGCLVHAWLCELTSRITAMDSAVRNGNKILDRLTMLFHRMRQSAITQEITEIVASASAMEGGA